MLELMRGEYDVREIWDEGSQDVTDRLSPLGSNSRKLRGQTDVAQPTKLTKKVWPNRVAIQLTNNSD